MARIDPALPRPGEQAPPPWILPPSDWYGSVPDWSIYWASVQRYGDGLERSGEYYGGDEWAYRVGIYGQFLPAGFIPDFTFYDVNVTINIFEEQIDVEIEHLRARILRSLRPPITHVMIDAEDAIREPAFYLDEALNGITHSQVGEL